jgi:DNA repair protein RecO
MNTITTRAIVISRRSYGEADRIITVMTSDRGKVHLMAKGVRRPKSKLASGIELLSINQITYISGRSSLATLTSAKSEQQFAHITSDIDRTMYAYDVLKCVGTITEDDAGEEYYQLLAQTLEALDDMSLPLTVTSLWFDLAILSLTGHQPNLRTDIDGNPLQPDETYVFSFDDMSFARSPAATDGAALIKLLRLAVASDSPRLIAKVADVDELLPQAKNLASTMRKYTLKV